MTVAQFSKLAPGIDWNNVLSALKVSNADTVIVGQPEFYSALSSTLKKYSISDWKAYLEFKLINSYAGYLQQSHR